MKWLPSKRHAEWALTAGIVAVLVATVWMRFSPAEITAAPNPYPPTEAGIDTALVLIVSSTCPACSNEQTVTEIAGLLDRLVGSRPTHHTIRLLGIAVDLDPVVGYGFLRELGRFDEVAVGGGMGNLLFSEFVWQDSAGVPAIPQLIMLERNIARSGERLVEEYRKAEVLAVGGRQVIASLTSVAQTGVVNAD